MAAIVTSLIADQPWPVPDVLPEELSPVRFARQSA